MHNKTISIKSKEVSWMPPTTAGEVCTEAKAIELGLYNETQKTYVAGLEDMRTYSAANPNDYRKREALCRPSGDGAYAYPLCPIQHGFAFSQVPGDPSRCTVQACPTGFTPGPNQTCVKPTNSIVKNKPDICDEKPHDWYSVPYYQLGNGYRRVAGKCYEPCEAKGVDLLPLVSTDPVDKAEWDIVFTKETPLNGSKCIKIGDYMGGKYSAANDVATKHCPAAVIKRLSVSAEGLQADMKAIAATETEGILDQIPSAMRVRMNSLLSAEANTVATKSKENLRNVKPISLPMKIACDRAVPPEEMAGLYATCKDLKDRPGTILQTWRTDDASLTPDMVRTRRTVMEQACHEVFCNNPENASGAGGQPICFTNLPQVSQKDLDIHNRHATFEAKKAEINADGSRDAIDTISGRAPDSGFVSFFPKKYIKTILTFMTIVLTFIGLVLIFKIVMMIFNYNELKVLDDIRRENEAALGKKGLGEFLISKLPMDKIKGAMEGLKQNQPLTQQNAGLMGKLQALASKK